MSSPDDNSECQQMEAALRHSETESRRQLALLQTIYATAPAGLCFLDTGLRYVYINEQLASTNGLPAARHIGKTLREVIPHLADQFEPLLRRLLDTGEAIVNKEVCAPSGSDPGVERDWLLSYYPVRGDREEMLGINTVVVEITRHKQLERALRESENLHRAVTQEVSDALFVIEPAGEDYLCTFVNPAYSQLTGLSAQQMIGRTARELFPSEIWRGFHTRYTQAIAAGRMIEYEEHIDVPAGRIDVVTRLVPMFDESGRCVRLVGSAHDITARKRQAQEMEAANERLADINARLEQQIALVNAQAVQLELQKDALKDANARLESLATMDGLTGIKNHRAFQEQLAQDVERSARSGDPLSLLVLDVDRFKRFNDAFGHPTGDKILKAVAQLLKDHARASDFVARYGGEEFVVILPATDREGAMEAAARFRAAVEAHPWQERAITISIGAATLAPGQNTPQALIEWADKALYQSKLRGRNRIIHAEEISAESSPM